MNKIISSLLCAGVLACCLGCSPGKETVDEAAVQTAAEAYTYALPLVIMDLTMKNMTNPGGPRGAKPINQFTHSREIFTAADKMVVRSNIDTLYSNGWLDLSIEPIVFSKPNTGDIYCSIAVFDAYTNCSFILGTGGMDNGRAAEYVFCGPDYRGATPAGMIKIPMPTNMAWVIVRTEYLALRLDEIHEDIQDNLTLVPLSKCNSGYIPPDGEHNPDYDYVPLDEIKKMDIAKFFNEFNRLSAGNPGSGADKPALDKFAKIGIGPGLGFNLSAFSPATQKKLADLPKDTIGELGEPESVLRYAEIVNGWMYMDSSIARFGTNYEYRAIIALTGLGGNPVDMAVYPSAARASDGQQLNGAKNYTITFEKNQFPPCNAFWSITAYDHDGFFYDNILDKYAITDRDAFAENPDGSVTIYLQHASPGGGKEANWLPVPSAAFQLTMRIYLPKPEVIDGNWKPPVVLVK
jgi:hypothetical protein